MRKRKLPRSVTESVRAIVLKEGAVREWHVMAQKPVMHQSETWNKFHKVVSVVASIPDLDGHCDSFDVDIVTGKICG